MGEEGMTAHSRTDGVEGTVARDVAQKKLRTRGKTKSELMQVTLNSEGHVVGTSVRHANNEGVTVGEHFPILETLKRNFKELDKWFKAMKSKK